METRNCQNCKKDFIIEQGDFGFYEKMGVPVPTFCPECRQQRRWAWRNDISLYNRTCDLCKKSVISIYSPESGRTVYCVKCWWSDKWDPKNYGVDYDFSKSFFEQFKKLQQRVPVLALMNDNSLLNGSLNCEYTQDFAYGKNCYMVFIAWRIENVMYSYHTSAGKDMMDCLHIRSKNEWLYQCMIARNCYELKYSQFCIACVDSQFLYDCGSCTNCFMCTGLRNKKYHYKNKEYSKEEYEKILKSYQLDTYSGVEKAQKEYDEFILNYPRKGPNNLQNVNCIGDLISNSKNCQYCFAVKGAENCRWVDIADSPKDSHDMATGGELSECYEGITCDHSSRNFFGIFSWKCQDVKYTEHCHTCKDVFGSVGLRNAKYCILNKQYTKEEYDKLVTKIIEQMNQVPYIDKRGIKYKYGEFYPIELSPFGYNETVAQDHLALSKEEILKRGFKWQENIQRTKNKETLLPDKIPESIHDVDDLILNEVLACVNCKRNYKIIPNELIFYKKMEIPIPRLCFHCRHTNRIKRRNPFQLWHRTCMCNKKHSHHTGNCEIEFETSYAPDRPEIVYCEKCYQQEVY